jgi:hypothetical protein
MGGVIRFQRPIASSAVIASLVALGYLQQANRHRDSAIERAIEKLRHDLYCSGVIQAGDLSPIEAQATPLAIEAGGIASDITRLPDLLDSDVASSSRMASGVADAGSPKQSEDHKRESDQQDKVAR